MQISVIIPIYNVEQYLSECLESLLLHNDAAFLNEIEIIGIDDCSPDNSASIFNNFIENFPDYNIKLIRHKKNKGLGGARNTGIRASKGKYILFLDSDDTLTEKSLDYLIPHTRKNNRILVFGLAAKKNGSTVWNYTPSKNEIIQKDKALEMFAKDEIIPSACNKLFPREMLRNLKFKEDLYYEDLEFTPQAINYFSEIEFTTKTLYNYRLDGASITRQTTTSKHIKDLTKVLVSLSEKISNPKIFSTLLLNRWGHMLRSWNLSNNLKSVALKEFLHFLQAEEFKLDFTEGKKAATFINENLESFEYDLHFAELKKKVLKLLKFDFANHTHIANLKFDKIYVINLPFYEKRKYTISKKLIDENINFQVWEATNGYSESNKKKYNDYLKRGIGSFKHFHEYDNIEKNRGSKFIESPGALGVIQSYISILLDAKSKGYESILVFEDDAILVDNFESKLKDFFEAIDSNWKLLLLGASQYSWDKIPENSERKGYYHPINLETCGAFALGIHKSVYDELIEVQSYFDAPFDHIPIGSLYKKYQKQCFVSFPNICVPNVTSSTIREERDQFKHSLKMKWNLSDYEFPPQKFSVSIIINSKRNLKYINVTTSKLNEVFDVRWFINSSSGLRPIHQNLYLDENKIAFTKEVNSNTGLTSDFVFSLSNDLVLTDELIYDKISSFLHTDSFQIENESLETNGLKKITSLYSNVERSRVENNGLVTVIIPTHGRSTNLSNALNSIVSQSYEKIEIIVVDDNPANSLIKKETAKIVQEFQSKHLIKYISHEKNLNGAAARNTGFLHSSGEYICFLDDDDIYLTEKIKKSLENLKSLEKKFGGVYCGYFGWNAKEADLTRFKPGKLTFELLSLDFKSHYLHTNTALYRRSALEKINGFDETFNRHQDLEFNIRFFRHFEIGVVEEVLVHLNPVTSETTNRVFNEDIAKLKEKFLSRFVPDIKKFSFQEQKLIYSRNWHEAKNLFDSDENFLNYFESKADFKYSVVEVIDKLDVEKKTQNKKNYSPDLSKINEIGKTSPIAAHSKKNDEDLEINKCKAELARLDGLFHLESLALREMKEKAEELKEVIKDLEQQKSWYSRTYDHLPNLYLKVGGIFRRIKIKKSF
ncbi:glycosyltransferase [Brumimicrobium glaciale]|uniref:Glycosyltransferase n=1 Tax=Brumimicrobium glaciale TaxID=200475 RepID=A0A4Q4KKW4_9FLAO|nr:glycosyltransferase [Brumimicrobium glaciale]RYM34013.1 glycosyltransferase [Brumimicrobium glaciale]